MTDEKHNNRKTQYLCIALCLSAGLSGCGQFVNPKPERIPFDQKIERLTENNIEYTFENADAYLSYARKKMTDYADHIAKVRNGSGAGAVASALGGAASAIFGAHPDYLLGFTLSGGTFLATSQLYGNQNFEKIYEEGVTALACVANETQKYLKAGSKYKTLRMDTSEYVEIHQKLSRIEEISDRHISNLEKIIKDQDKIIADQDIIINGTGDDITKNFAKDNSEAAKENKLSACISKKEITKIKYESTSTKDKLSGYFKNYGISEKLYSTEIKISSLVVSAVDNIFIQVRKKIMQSDPGLNGVQNAISNISGITTNTDTPGDPGTKVEPVTNSDTQGCTELGTSKEEEQIVKNNQQYKNYISSFNDDLLKDKILKNENGIKYLESIELLSFENKYYTKKDMNDLLNMLSNTEINLERCNIKDSGIPEFVIATPPITNGRIEIKTGSTNNESLTTTIILKGGQPLYNSTITRSDFSTTIEQIGIDTFKISGSDIDMTGTGVSKSTSIAFRDSMGTIISVDIALIPPTS